MAQTTVAFYAPASRIPVCVPLMVFRIAAGFPKPSDDYLEAQIDINDLLIDQPAATFIVRVAEDGTSMEGEGIRPGDYIVVNRAAPWRDGSIVVARICDEFTLKRIRRVGRRVFLQPANPRFQAIELTEESDCEVWGCVTGSFRRY